MPAWALTILSAVGTTLLGMLASLATEAFLKKAVILALRKLASKTESTVDDELLKAAEEAWEKK